MLMINKITSFNKKGKGKQRGTSSRMESKLSLPRRSPKLEQSLKLSDYTTKEMVTRSGKCLEYLVDKKDGKVNKEC